MGIQVCSAYVCLSVGYKPYLYCPITRGISLLVYQIMPDRKIAPVVLIEQLWVKYLIIIQQLVALVLYGISLAETSEFDVDAGSLF